MSRDVLALCLAFEAGSTVAAACATRPAGLDPETARGFCEVLAARGILESEGEPDPLGLARRRPYVPRLAVWQRVGDDAVVYGRATSVRVAGAADFLAAADGTRALSDCAPATRWSALLRLCEADLAALKLLPSGSGRPPWAESTMPWSAADPHDLVATGGAGRTPSDLTGYHVAIDEPEAQFDETETTLSHLFREPHAALGGETFGARLARGLLARGAPAHPVRAVEVGGGLGFVGRALVDAFVPASYLVVDRSPALARAQRRCGLLSVVGDGIALPIADRSVDLLISNEMAGDLPTREGVNVGALALVDECARVLAPGGLAYLSEFGHPTEAPRRSDHLDHDEYSLRFEDLRERAVFHGLSAELVQVPSLLGLDPAPMALVTTRASFAALRTLFAAHGGMLAKRAWLAAEFIVAAQRIGIDTTNLHGVVTAPLGVRTMGLVPSEFWAIILRYFRT